MSIQTDIRNQMKEAMIARDAVKLSVLRGLIAAFTNELVAKKMKPDEELGDSDALSVISKQARQRKDSIEQFERGGRQELADAEKAELAILESYLPSQMSDEEIEKFVKDKQAELGITDKAKAGQLLGILMKELKGKAEGGRVKAVVDKLLA